VKTVLHRASQNSPRLPQRRRGLVLLTVLICIVLLSLAAYNFSDLMVSEYSAADNYHKIAQARAFADSGVQYAMAAISSSEALTTTLNNNPFDNAMVFQGHAVSHGNADAAGYFSLIAPLNLNGSSSSGICQFGVMDEGAKINLNSMMILDPTGNTLYNMLILLPNMTSNIANCILDWIDPDETTRDGGAESDYYSGLTPSYSCKDGPLDSLEELLLVQGVTPALLYGSDLNRNGYIDQNESNGDNNTPSAVDLGWSMYLTVDSREQVPFNPTTNLPLINVNDTTVYLQTMYGSLSSALGDDMAKFITMYRILGPSSSSTGSTQSTGATLGAILGGGGGGTTGGNTNSVQGTLSSYQIDLTQTPKTQIKSLYDLVNAQVSVQSTSTSTSAGRGGKMTTTTTMTTTVYSSPLSDPGQQATLLPLLFQSCTTWTTPEIPARINLTNASQEVLTALTGATNLSTSDVQAILSAQPQYDSSSTNVELYQTPAWLITQASISPSKLSKMDQYVTTNSQVFRVQSIGYSDPNKGQTSRIEAVIDANYYIPNANGVAQPRLLRWRIMDDFGKFRPPSNN
jgi:type II secretory pathway component PulK